MMPRVTGHFTIQVDTMSRGNIHTWTDCRVKTAYCYRLTVDVDLWSNSVFWWELNFMIHAPLLTTHDAGVSLPHVLPTTHVIVSLKREDAEWAKYIGIWVSAPIPVVLSFVYLSQQSTLLQCVPTVLTWAYTIFSCIYPAYIYNLHTPIPCTKLHFQYNKIVCKIFIERSQMTKAPNGVGTLPNYQSPE